MTRPITDYAAVSGHEYQVALALIQNGKCVLRRQSLLRIQLGDNRADVLIEDDLQQARSRRRTPDLDIVWVGAYRNSACITNRSGSEALIVWRTPVEASSRCNPQGTIASARKATDCNALELFHSRRTRALLAIEKVDAIFDGADNQMRVSVGEKTNDVWRSVARPGVSDAPILKLFDAPTEARNESLAAKLSSRAHAANSVDSPSARLDACEGQAL